TAGRLANSYGQHQIPEEAEPPERVTPPAQHGREERAENLDEEGARRGRRRRRRGGGDPSTRGRPRSGQGRQQARPAQANRGAEEEPLGEGCQPGRRGCLGLLGPLWGRRYAAIATIRPGITTSPLAPDFNARSASVIRSWMTTSSSIE